MLEVTFPLKSPNILDQIIEEYESKPGKFLNLYVDFFIKKYVMSLR